MGYQLIYVKFKQKFLFMTPMRYLSGGFYVIYGYNWSLFYLISKNIDNRFLII